MLTAQGSGVGTPVRFEPGQLLAAVAKGLKNAKTVYSSDLAAINTDIMNGRFCGEWKVLWCSSTVWLLSTQT